MFELLIATITLQKLMITNFKLQEDWLDAIRVQILNSLDSVLTPLLLLYVVHLTSFGLVLFLMKAI